MTQAPGVTWRRQPHARAKIKIYKCKKQYIDTFIAVIFEFRICFFFHQSATVLIAPER